MVHFIEFIVLNLSKFLIILINSENVCIELYRVSIVNFSLSVQNGKGNLSISAGACLPELMSFYLSSHLSYLGTAPPMEIGYTISPSTKILLLSL